ncbi:MAG TPA: alanine--glyoxylate aminotransferase family protein [Solirubrobacteraceae bacterium]|nr:alanine--glyoxylate aminotransferase family protein [Solirubrobacteraceae bacterium]
MTHEAPATAAVPAAGAAGCGGRGAVDRAAVAVPERLLLGSGPSPVPERVRRALARPTLGHMDPAFGAIMDHTVAQLREVFLTANRATLPLSATGSGGMDAMVANFVEPGDRVVCAVNGLFGERMADALARAGAEVVRVEAPWGRAVAPEALVEAARDGLRAMAVVHGETSTGVCQPLDGLAEACREREALLLVDCVTSLSGQRVAIDDWGVDAAFSGTQKCLNCPPGLAPFTAGERAIERVRSRRTPVRSWYFDLSLLLGYWSESGPGGRTYHHTAPINMIYGLDEALRLVLEEPLPERWERHRRAHEALRGALGVMGFERLAPAGEQLNPLLAVRVPDGIEEAAARASLLNEHGIEISGGLGPLAGRVWRIGVMGVGARLEPQARLVRALGSVLGREPGDALEALQAGWSA